MKHESAQERELRQAGRWLEWSTNPCGKPRLHVAKLHRFDKPQVDVPTLGVDLADERASRDPQNRKAMIGALESAWHHNRAFPGQLVGYYEGGEVDGAWRLEIYGEGEPWPVKPEPPKPAYLR